MNYKKLISSILTFSLLGTCGMSAFPLTSSAAETDMEFYISPNGDDANSGSAEAPFKTLERAREEVSRYNSNMDSNIIVNIAPGTYYMSDTLELTPEDSGSNGFKVIYRGIPDSDGQDYNQRRC